MNPWSNALWLNEHGPQVSLFIIPAKGKTTATLATQPTIQAFKIPEAKGERSPAVGTDNLFFTGKIRRCERMAFYDS